MIKDLFKPLLGLLLCCLLFNGAWQGSTYAADKGETYDFSFTSAYMDKHPTVKNAFVPWAREVEKYQYMH